MTYQEQLLDPRWQKKRLYILNRDGWKCTLCGDEKTTLHIHHEKYGKYAWEVSDEFLATVCTHCHLLKEYYKINYTKCKIDIQKVNKKESDFGWIILYVYRLRDNDIKLFDIFTINNDDPNDLKLGIIFCEHDLNSFIDFITEIKIDNG